jgi:5-methylcytosine-specific restriction protein A
MSFPVPIAPGIHRPQADGVGSSRHDREKARKAAIDARRGSSAQRGYGHKWRKYRIRYLAEHPLCRHCEEKGHLVPATVVDHIERHRGDPHLMWSPRNHQSLCKRCHDRKTATEGLNQNL